MSRARVFVRCVTCTHATVTTPGAACRLCGSPVVAADPPQDLWNGWRCGCFQCVRSGPC